ncbi:CorA family divalent cation transporter [Phragmitibacter flavus]|nr:CorA family divalent cation transporter [Phragmitibacter flavus]
MTGPTKPESSPVPKMWALPEAIRARLGRDAGPQRAIFEESHLLLILHKPPLPDQHERTPAFFWRSPTGEWRCTEGRGGLTSLLELLETYEKKVLELESLEGKASRAQDFHSLLEELAPILRASRGLHRALQQARELVKTDRDLITLRDQAAAIERSADLLLQDAQFGLNFTVARQSEAQSEAAHKMAGTAHRLNIIAALFLPITAIASIFGMEIRSGLADTPTNFTLILMVGVALGVVVTLLVNQRKV